MLVRRQDERRERRARPAGDPDRARGRPACGLLNGLLVTRLKLPPFIVTLGTLSIFTALGLLYTKGQSVQASDMPDFMTVDRQRDQARRLRHHLRRGHGGRLLYVVVALRPRPDRCGASTSTPSATTPRPRAWPASAVDRVLLSVYAVAGLIYGLTAWIQIGRANAASPNAITDGNLETITAVVIGGTSLFGGRGVLVGTALGALIVYFFRSGLSLAGVDDQYRILAIGILVIAAVAVDQWIRKVRA